MSVSARKSNKLKDERFEMGERILMLPSVSQYGISGLVVVQENERTNKRSAFLSVKNAKLASDPSRSLA